MSPTPVIVGCGICGEDGPWAFTLGWWDDIARTDVPGGVVLWLEPQPRQACACSEACARRFARAAGSLRLRITRPDADSRLLLRLTAQLEEDNHARRAA